MNYQEVQRVGVILAGGQSSRMHYQNKALLTLGEKRVIDHVVETLKPQVDYLVINANANLDQYQSLEVPLLTDIYGPNAGPIAGIATAMEWAKEQFPNVKTILCCPGDVPWFPDNIAERLEQALRNETCKVAWLCTDKQWQPLFSLWSIDLMDALHTALDDGLYSPMALIKSLPNTMVPLTNCQPGHFANLNTPEDLQKAQDILAID